MIDLIPQSPHRAIRSILWLALATGIAALLSLSTIVWASEPVTSLPQPPSYHFISHHRTTIDRSAKEVWPHLLKLGSWMVDFDMTHVSGPIQQEGEILKLYAQQDFLIQIEKIIPNTLIVAVNLPSTFRGEHSTGTSVISLNEINGRTIVDLTQIRVYTWLESGFNPLQELRQSAEFEQETNATWDRFLLRLKQIAEGLAVQNVPERRR